MLKTHNCGELSKKEVGKKVSLTGWVDTLRIQGKVSFLLLRDRTGIVQCFVSPEMTKTLTGTSPESVVLVEGTVKARPANQLKKKLTPPKI